MKKNNTIGIFHYQLGFTDGVSLEVDKWKEVLESMGHRVLLCAGRFGSQEGIQLPELYHHRPECVMVNQNLLGLRDDLPTPTLEKLVQEQIVNLERGLKDIIIENKIEILLVNNIWSVALNIPAAIALENVRKELDLKAFAHHHDFYWERIINRVLNRKGINHILEKYQPPRDPKIKNFVINSIAQSSLQEFKGLTSKVVPNVFDFDGEDWVIDHYNQDLRQRIGLREGDICILQATRIVPRKGIEMAIEVVKALNEPHRRAVLEQRGLYNGCEFNSNNKIVLVLAGYDRDDPSGVYLKKLKAKAENLGIDLRHIDSIVSSERKVENGEKKYALWDTYAIADLITYPSIWEGWGNQLLEAFKAKLPIVMFEYPVYLQDIKKKGFDVISLGSEMIGRDQLSLVLISDETIQQAANECVTFLTSQAAREKMVNKNYSIAKKYYSMDELKAQLEKCF